MQGRWNSILSNALSDLPTVYAAGRDWPLKLVRHAAARRYRMVFDALRGELRLTLPRRASDRQALAWAREQGEWIAAQARKDLGPLLIGPDASLPIRGTPRRIQWDPAQPRRVRDDGLNLILGGPRETVGPRLQRWLRAEAQAMLDEESRAMAAAHGLSVTSVSVADPRSRWGSCAADGRLRYSWRLFLAPDHVRRATVAHEVAHLVHMHHGPDFHRLVDEIFGGPVDDARRWLRLHGRSLHRYRFT